MRIIITESQLKRIIEKELTENIESLGDNPSGIPEYSDNEVSPDVTVTDTDGDTKMSKKKTLDKIGADETPSFMHKGFRG